MNKCNSTFLTSSFFLITTIIYLVQVGVNTGMLSASESPFGGIEQSGYGKEGSYMGIDDYMTTKAINIDIS